VKKDWPYRIEEVEEKINNIYEVETINETDYIKNMEEQITIVTLKEKINLPEYYKIEITNIDGIILTDMQNIGTGSTITIKKENNEIIKSYKVVVKGDIDGNGTVNFVDIIKLIQYVYDPEENFEWVETIKKAGKVTSTVGTPGFADIMLMIRYVFEGVNWK